jgi:hypothetical protein
MAAVAHNPAFAKKAGVPQSVGKEFNEADKGRKFAKGGDTMAKKSSELDDDVATVKRALYKQPGDAALYSRERGLSPGMARRRLDDRGVDVRALVANEQNPDDLGNFKKGGNVKKMNMGGYADGGMPMVMKDGQKVPAFAADGKGKMAKGGMTKGKMPAALAKHADMPASKAHKGLKAGGSVGTTKMGAVKTAAPSRDGIAITGKTRGTPIKMARGGKTC